MISVRSDESCWPSLSLDQKWKIILISAVIYLQDSIPWHQEIFAFQTTLCRYRCVRLAEEAVYLRVGFAAENETMVVLSRSGAVASSPSSYHALDILGMDIYCLTACLCSHYINSLHLSHWSRISLSLQSIPSFPILLLLALISLLLCISLNH
jgi:hypothetical protein